MTKTPKNYPARKVSLPISRGLIFLDANDIIYIASRDMWVSVFTLEEEYQVPLTIKHLYAKVLPTFVRTHRSYLINPSHIVEYCKVDGVIRLSKEHQVPVSRRSRKRVEEEMKLFIEKYG